MREIRTSNGFTILVSDEDFEWASRYAWYPSVVGKCGTRYAIRSESRNRTHKSFYMHREIVDRMGILLAPGIHVDHINRNSLDNRRENLRVCSRSQNAANSFRKAKAGKPPFKGIYFVKRSKINPWAAHIMHNYRSVYLGLHPTPEAAARRYDEEARKIFGDHAALNFPAAQ